MISFSTRFRFASIRHKEGAVSAIILDCESKGEALRLFTYLSDYLVSKDVAKVLDLQFTQTVTNVGNFLLHTHYDEQSMECRIEGIDWCHVESLKESLMAHACYMILTGYIDQYGQFQLLSPSLHHILRSGILVNSVCISGRIGTKIDYSKIVEALG